MFQETGFRRLAKTVTNLRTDRLRRVSARDAVASKKFDLHLLLGLLLPAGELVDREDNSYCYYDINNNNNNNNNSYWWLGRTIVSGKSRLRVDSKLDFHNVKCGSIRMRMMKTWSIEQFAPKADESFIMAWDGRRCWQEKMSIGWRKML